MDALTAPAHDVGEHIGEELAKNSCVHRVADEVRDLVGGHLLVVSPTAWEVTREEGVSRNAHHRHGLARGRQTLVTRRPQKGLLRLRGNEMPRRVR